MRSPLASSSRIMKRRGLGDAEAGHCGVDVAATVVDREDVARVDFQRFIAALKFERDDPPGLRAKIADGIVRALQFVRSFGEAEFLDIEGSGTGDERYLAHPPGNQRLVARHAGAQRAVDILREIIHEPVADPEIDMDVRVALVEIAKRRHDDLFGEGAGHFDAQAAAR